MKLLDLFCGAGGAAVGYHWAGFEIVGVDNKPQKHYPYEFHQADAFSYLREHGTGFDVIHASPPCQAFSSMKSMWNAKKNHEDLLTPLRPLLIATGKIYVIENVYGAPLILPVMLCGTAFHLRTADGLGELRRHRYFESSVFLGPTPPCQHNGPVIGVYGGHGRDRRRDGALKFNTQARKEAMGIDWMNGNELSQAIPPAYTEWIGRRLIGIMDNSAPDGHTDSEDPE